MVSLGDEVFSIGGRGTYEEFDILSDIYQLKCYGSLPSQCQWSKHQTPIQYARFEYIAMLIPDVFTDCASIAPTFALASTTAIS